ncbi:uncharacterized protein TRIADDRAFT_55111 [Trichoplax adhaerens]|uniref:Uncharacterized protein n=1 Tax=Trichoplax adhaerens TaxID=10228 RepID=B3RU03_TRIAD|nr:hypothetical protein TRIADDRAFT_55111 [Trichoplax adhaerens]EDV25258.1 hypothetical protein TRIADDRAFT_55111 [Trichoplax adhaerens]|eukprot:XP_002111291.1 hypothetical protein TRIADDRAFT_55111 [Trichoplax adhaerens]
METGVTKRVNDRVASAKNRRLALQLSKRTGAQAAVRSTGNLSNRFGAINKNVGAATNTRDARYRLNERTNRSSRPSSQGDVKSRLGYPSNRRGSPTKRGSGGRGMRGNWVRRGRQGRIGGRGLGRGAYQNDWNPTNNNSHYNENSAGYQKQRGNKSNSNRAEYPSRNRGRRGRGGRNRRGRRNGRDTRNNFESKDNNGGDISIQISNDRSEEQDDKARIEDDLDDYRNDEEVVGDDNEEDEAPLEEEMETEID